MILKKYIPSGINFKRLETSKIFKKRNTALSILLESQSIPSYKPSPDVAHMLCMYLSINIHFHDQRVVNNKMGNNPAKKLKVNQTTLKKSKLFTPSSVF